MPSILAVSSLLAVVRIVSAASPTGYGRFPCTIVNGDGTFSPDASRCLDQNLVAVEDQQGTGGYQGNNPNPTGSSCAREIETGAYFCGIAGATCTDTSNCDNGVCVNGVCQGGFNQACAGTDSNCSGFLYCTDVNSATTAADTCGAFAAFCQDPDAGSSSLTDAQNEAIFNQFCASGYCSFNGAECSTHVAAGGDCSADPQFACVNGYHCDATTLTCVINASGSQRARARRNELPGGRRALCPASYEACSIPGISGFECVDTQTNLEQCGACASQGGVDCTTLPGAEAVGCVAGVCEIWACAEGFVLDEATSSCSPVLLH